MLLQHKGIEKNELISYCGLIIFTSGIISSEEILECYGQDSIFTFITHFIGIGQYILSCGLFEYKHIKKYVNYLYILIRTIIRSGNDAFFQFVKELYTIIQGSEINAINIDYIVVFYQWGDIFNKLINIEFVERNWILIR